MRPIANWLVARPWNAVLGLSLTLLMPFAQILSGAVIGMLVLANGVRIAILQALAAAAVLSGLFLVFGNPLLPMLVSALVSWLPVVLLSAVMRQSRSIRLALQVSAVAAVLVTLGFFIVLEDPTAFWTAQLNELATAFGEMGFAAQAEALAAKRDLIAPQMTMLFVATSWSLVVLVTVLGYALFQRLPEQRGRYGRFCDMHFGRVLAVAMAIAVLAAVVTQVALLQNLAFVLFAVFWIQGAAIVHWLHSDGPLPFLAVIAIYALMPFLNALLVIGLAVLGYTDAWFNYRPRIQAARTAD